jgi:intein/homing endonuclease
MPEGSLKKGLLMVGTVLAIFIIAHYTITKNRMQNVLEAFKNGKTIICENRIYTKGANFIELKNNGDWKIENNHFKNKNFTRDFFIARCIVK